MHFLDEVLSRDVVHIDDFILLGDSHVPLDILSSCVIYQPFYLRQTIFLFSSLFFLTCFNMRVM
jgi:hypothetical protein